MKVAKFTFRKDYSDMLKNKPFLFCLILLLVSIILLFTLSLKTGSVSSQVDDMKKQVNIKD